MSQSGQFFLKVSRTFTSQSISYYNFYNIIKTSVISDPLGEITITCRSDNRRTKTTGLNGVGRVGLGLDN